MDETLFQKYADVCTRLKALEDEKKEIGLVVAEHMNELKADKIQSPIGTFSFTERTTWSFSEEVAIAEEEVDAIKEEEKKNGIAKSTVARSLRFQGLKAKE